MSVQFPFVMVGPPLASVIVDASGGTYHFAFLFAGLVVLASNVFLLPLMRKYEFRLSFACHCLTPLLPYRQNRRVVPLALVTVASLPPPPAPR